MSKMFEPVIRQMQREADMRAQEAADVQRRIMADQARLDAPVTRRELLDAIGEVRDHFGGSGFPEQEAIYDAFATQGCLIMTTIYDALAARLGRKPTHEETKAEVRRIIGEAYEAVAAAGKLAHQRK